jgi:hypothetical protein
VGCYLGSPGIGSHRLPPQIAHHRCTGPSGSGRASVPIKTMARFTGECCALDEMNCVYLYVLLAAMGHMTAR